MQIAVMRLTICSGILGKRNISPRPVNRTVVLILPDIRAPLKALPRRRSQSCCVKSSEARDFVSQQWSGKAAGCDGDEATSSLDEFLQQTVENTFTVSGMVFQDAYNLDLDRLRRCYICEVDTDKGMVPFCAYNLTDIHGRSLYRR